MKRIGLVLIVAYGSWLAMLVLHEAGHVVHAWVSGGEVVGVYVPLLGFSRTDLGHNPHPLFFAWGGVVWGCVLPAVIFGLVRWARLPDLRVPLYWLGLCLIANGAYLGVGSIVGAGDAGDLLRLGAPPWALVAFGAITVTAGFYCWHRLGPGMGLGASRPAVRKTAKQILKGP